MDSVIPKVTAFDETSALVCVQCGEVFLLRDRGRRRHCPVDASCAPVTGWEEFLAHIYHRHTSGTEEERQSAVQRLLEGRKEERS